ncbi:hypothetical protein [Georgenia sp. Z1491]|uniref:hypothetical protein n=1 Tax=Georgenia sp. Z1491 TaxID=3416707 RepID=UPI003CEE0A0A
MTEQVDRLAAARAALVRAETATGLRTRLRVVGGSEAPDGGAHPGGNVPDGGAHLVADRPAAPGRARAEESLPERARATTSGDAEHLPVPAALAPLLPAGLPRGTVTRVTGSAALLLALAGAACGQEGWAALTAMPDVGWRAAAAAGLPLDRVVVVPDPGPGAPAVLGALVDGVEVLLVGRCTAMAPRDRRSLLSRLRLRGSVLLTAHAWEGADAVLSVHGRTWQGLAPGRGMLTAQEVDVSIDGRRGAAAGGSVRVLLGADGVSALPGDAGVRGGARADGTRGAVGDDVRDGGRQVAGTAALRAVGA